MTTTSTSVVLPGGLRLDYVEQGDRTGVPVVLLHGVTDSWRSFEPVLPHLPASMHALAVSQRGHGDSDRPAGGYAPLHFAEDLATFLDALDLGPAIIVGHSMSSSIAQRFALEHPAHTLGLVLVASMRAWRSTPAVVDFWRTTVASLRDPIDPALARDFQLSTLAAPVAPAFLDTVVQESLKVPARVWRGVFSAFIGDDFSAELDAITAPALIVWGDRDAFCPGEDQVALATAIADSTLRVYAGTGHALHWEQPARFAADLVAWVEQAAGVRCTS
jgi:pimeloyl-ACP methyl ester carboxylesterase